jgi:hypothetical protein
MLTVGAPAAVGAPAQDTATLKVTSEGPQVHVDLRAPAVGLVGFAHGPRTADERETLSLAVENLKTGDGLVRFNSQAGCWLKDARVDSDPAPRDKSQGELGASYVFHCDQPKSLSSAALGLFMGFPALARAHVYYEVAGAAGAAVLTPANPVVSFVPLR